MNNGLGLLNVPLTFAMPFACTVSDVNVRSINAFPTLSATFLKGTGFVVPTTSVGSCSSAPCTIAANQAFAAGDSFAVLLDGGGSQVGTTSGGISVEFICQ